MKHTTYYHLNQPEATDVVRVAHFNENADILDGELRRLATEKADAAAVQGSFDAHTGNRLNPHGVTASQAGALPAANRGAPGGVASLDTVGLVPVSQLPLPRKNLLHNWYFPAPINQRGQTSYAGNTVYTADRWKINGSGTQVTLAGGELVLSASAYERVQQHLERPEQLNGQMITVSALVRNPNGAARIVMHNLTQAVTMTLADVPASSAYQIISATVVANISAGDSVFVGLYPGANDAATPRTAYFKAAKLELGDTQTLARKNAAGNWVLLDPPPDYGTELAKCQRYQIPLGTTLLGRTSIASETAVSARVFLPVTLRTRPTLAAPASDFRVYFNGTSRTPTAVSVSGFASNEVTLSFTIPSGIGGMQPVFVEYAGSGGMLDANL